MGRIRVLQILDKISNGSGVCSVVMNYYNYIDKDKVIFDFMVNEPVPEKIKATLEMQGSKIFIMPGLKNRNLFRYKKQLQKFFSEHKEYKIVHGHTPNAAAFYLTEAKKAGIKIRIIHSHNAIGSENLWKRFRNRILYKVAIKHANMYFTCGKKAAEYLYGKNFRKKYYILNNAIDLDKYKFDDSIRSEIRKKLNLEDNFVIGNVGRFCKQKNQKYSIGILEEVMKVDENIKLLLIGDGKQLDEVKLDAKRKNIADHVIFTGEVENVFDYLQAMDLFILPSLFEGLPVSCVEAQAMGLPCLISDTVTREIAFNKNVEFVSISDSPIKWRDQILRLKNINRENAVNISSYNIKDKASELTKLYCELIEKNGKQEM
ncbi:MAG: hypothetical protein PWP24_994 [Clostridiales bacterium]|nr:hypothetical protein [Clostridiales bacterium]